MRSTVISFVNVIEAARQNPKLLRTSFMTLPEPKLTLPRKSLRGARSAARSLRIAVLVESSRAFGRGILHGIAECMHDRRDWLVYYQEGGLGDLLPKWFDSWQGDRIIARIEDQRMARALVRKGVPVVDIRGVCAVPGVPVVKTDNTEIARHGADKRTSHPTPARA